MAPLGAVLTLAIIADILLALNERHVGYRARAGPASTRHNADSGGAYTAAVAHPCGVPGPKSARVQATARAPRSQIFRKSMACTV
jgi:hypothetical protein